MDRAYSFKFQVHHAFCLLTCLLAYSLGSVEFSPAQLIPHVTKQLYISMAMNLTVIYMRSNWPHYMSWCIPSIYSMSCRPHFVYRIHLHSTHRRINLSMRFNGIYASCWKRKKELIKEMFSVWKTTKISKNFVQSKYYVVENACSEVDQFGYLSSIFEVDSKYSEICTK